MHKLAMTDLLQMSGMPKVVSFSTGSMSFTDGEKNLQWYCTKPYWIMVTLQYLFKVMEQNQHYLGDLEHWPIFSYFNFSYINLPTNCSGTQTPDKYLVFISCSILDPALSHHKMLFTILFHRKALRV